MGARALLVLLTLFCRAEAQEESWELLTRRATELQQNGKLADAEAASLKALSLAGKLGPEDARLASSLNNLGSIYQDQGKLLQAESCYERSLAIWEKVLGPNHATLARPLNNLASLRLDRGEYARAEALHRRSLAIRTQTLGPDHPDVARVLNNLAMALYFQGKYSEAELLCRRSLEVWEKSVLEPPEKADALNTLALIRTKAGHTEETVALLQQAIRITEKASAAESPRLAQLLINLGQAHLGLRQYPEAERNLKRALGIAESSLGMEHPLVAAALIGQAAVYQQTRRKAAARRLERRARAMLGKHSRENLLHLQVDARALVPPKKD